MRDFLQRELKIRRSSGSYLFYGKDREIIFKEALDFAKAMNCKNSELFCDNCEICKRINKLTYGDLYILDGLKGIKIDEIREMIENSVSSAYEGGKKIFILRDIERMRKESSNALLKIIEEPARDTFFFLMTNSLNILSTIKSRAILVEVNNLIETDEEINPIFEIVDKFLSQRDFQDELDRISLVEEIIRQSERDREIYRKIVKRILYYFKKNKDLEKYLEIKKYFRFPINDRGILQTLFLKI